MPEQQQDRGIFGSPVGVIVAFVAISGFLYGGNSLMWGRWVQAAAGLGAMAIAVWIGSRLAKRPGPPDAPESQQP